MKIALINGSPKTTESNSKKMLLWLQSRLKNNNEITHYHINTKPFDTSNYTELLNHDIWVFAFPLYWDSLPSHLLKALVELERCLKEETTKNILVYTIVNNGFYEGNQGRIAFDIIEEWCKSTGLTFCGGFGQGAGEMMNFISNIPLGHGPLKKLGENMQELSNHIQANTKMDVTLFSPNFPKFAWKFMSTSQFWNAQAKKNGLNKKDILKRL